MQKKTMMCSPLITLALVAMLGLAACGGSSSVSSNVLTLGSANFVGPTNLTVKPGISVQIIDPTTTGSKHNLVTGTNGMFTAMDGAPPALSSSQGLSLNAGDTRTVTFAKPGTYQITCTIHPTMQATITVKL